MSRQRSKGYEDCEEYLDYGYSDDQEESYESESNEEEEDDGVDTPDVVDVTPLLCKTHGGNFSEDCAHCTALRVLIPKEQMAQLAGNSGVPDAASRFAAAQPGKKPTLLLDKTSLDFGKAVYTKGAMSQSEFKKLIQECLFLSKDQNKELCKNQELEPMLQKYLREPRFKNISKWLNLLLNLNKSNRIAQRPLLVAISEIDKMIRNLRQIGSSNYFDYPEVAPTRKVLSLTPVSDHTSFSSADPFPLPTLPSVLHGSDLPPDQQAIIEDNWGSIINQLKEYQVSVSEGFIDLYNKMADSTVKLDDFLTFYFSLAAHNDAMQLDEARATISMIFKPEVRPHVKGKFDTNEEREKFFRKGSGLLGGQDIVRDRIKSGVTDDAIVGKSILKKRVFKRYSQNNEDYDAPYKKVKLSGNDSKSSRTRKSYENSSGKRFRGASSRGRGSYRDRSYRDKHRDESPKDDRDDDSKHGGKEKNKSKFFSPKSFSEAWPNFFSIWAIKLVTAVGLLVDKLPFLHKKPIGGRIRFCHEAWIALTDNSWVCNVVRDGYKIPLRYFPFQKIQPVNPSVNKDAEKVLDDEAEALVLKQAIRSVSAIKGQYVSSYFAVPKPRSTKWRPILNLKWFNKKVRQYKFRMETFSQIRDWLQPGYFLIGMDLKDQFLTVPINENFRKFLRFSWRGQLFEWNVLPFGLTCSPRVVTKLLKPVMAFLRATWGILITVFMDDMLLQAATKERAFLHAQLVVLTLMSLGWELNWEKSNLIPSTEITHLGFEINTSTMTASCPVAKIDRLIAKATEILRAKIVTVHEAERLLGMMESVRPVTGLAALNYRSFQRQLIYAKKGQRIPTKVIILNCKSLANLRWWISDTGFKSNNTAQLREPAPNLCLWSDATKEAMGAHSSCGESYQREWTVSEMTANHSINFLELRAAKEAVRQLTKTGDVVRLYIDNVSACSYLSRQGGTRNFLLCREACRTWKIAERKGVTLLMPHWVSTKENVGADFLSRHNLNSWEIKLDVDLFQLLLDHFHLQPTLDAFASSKTNQLPRYMSWKEDKSAVGRNALMCKWDKVTYLFPPTPLLAKVVNKVKEEKIEAILVCPKWTSALWWPLVQELLVKPPLFLPHHNLALIAVEKMPLPYLEPLVGLHISGANQNLLIPKNF